MLAATTKAEIQGCTCSNAAARQLARRTRPPSPRTRGGRKISPSDCPALRLRGGSRWAGGETDLHAFSIALEVNGLFHGSALLSDVLGSARYSRER